MVIAPREENDEQVANSDSEDIPDPGDEGVALENSDAFTPKTPVEINMPFVLGNNNNEGFMKRR